MTPIRNEDDLKPIEKQYLTPLELSEKIGITQAGLKSWESQIKAFKPARKSGGERQYNRKAVAIAHIIRDLRKDDVGMKTIDKFLNNGKVPNIFEAYSILVGMKEIIKHYERYMEES